MAASNAATPKKIAAVAPHEDDAWLVSHGRERTKIGSRYTFLLLLLLLALLLAIKVQRSWRNKRKARSTGPVPDEAKLSN
jgi:hypothetical protein